MKKSYLIALLILGFFRSAEAQIFDFVQSKPRISWHQIQTENYRLIFPSTFDSLAYPLLHFINKAHISNQTELQVYPKKFPIVVQNMSLEANGFVQLAPRKSELFSSPSSMTDNQAWLSNLALHELRHIAQMHQLTGKLKKPFFEQLALAWYGLNLPAWYFEGDAVLHETLYAQGGRGRLPSWEMPLKANQLSGHRFSYDQYILGSFRQPIPSYYSIGYLLVSKLQNEFGPQAHEQLYSSINSHIIRPYNFKKAFKEVTAQHPKPFFTSMMSDLESRWQEQQQAKDRSNYPQIFKQESKYPSSYLLPKRNAQNELFAIRQGVQILPQLVRIAGEKEEKLFFLGSQLAAHYSLKDSLITWDEYRVDERYKVNSYQVINIYNLHTKKIKQLTYKSRYYSPTFHPLKEQLAVVEVSLSNQASLVLLDQHHGEAVLEIQMPEGIHIQQPEFNARGEKVICIAISELGTALLEIDIATKQLNYLSAWGNQQYERPSYLLDDIIFKAHFNGSDNIYRWKAANRQIYQLTDATYGAFNPKVDIQNNQLLFNDYQYLGYQAVELSLDSLKDIPLQELKDAFTHYYKPSLAYIEQQTDRSQNGYSSSSFATDSLAHTNPIQPYSGLGRTFNFHSLSISSTQFDSFDNYKPGLFWISNNVLNTTQATLGYEFDTDRHKSNYIAELAYQKYFPKFTIRYQNRGQVGSARAQSNPDSLIGFDWRDHHITAQMSIPISFYRQQNVYSMGFQISSSYTKRYGLSHSITNFQTAIEFPLSYQIYIHKLRRMARLDLAPKWGQQLSITYRHLPFEQQLSGNILSARTNFYFPGIISNHSFQVRASAQDGKQIYQYSQDIPMVSAFGFFRSPRIKNTLLLNYRFPIAYPDLALGGMAFIKRIKAGIFADYQNITDEKSWAPKTFGISVSADLNAFRYVLPNIDIAYKLSYINDASATQRIVPAFSISYQY